MKEFEVKQVVQKILENKGGIKNIEIGDNASGSKEYYFQYPENKFLWSIVKTSNGGHGLYYYPSKDDKFNFLNVLSESVGEFDDPLNQLFDIIHTKAYGFDEVIEDILNS